MKFDSLEDGVTFYRNYAKICGFTIRMSSVKKSKSDGAIMFKYCVCSKEGFKETPKVAPKSNQKRAVTRVGCKARVTFRLCKEGDNMVFAFHKGHSHVLSTPTSMHHTK
ncbi:Protein FAR1-RELATED SEQUENCE 5 [Bienertia sinuspersici]